MIIKISEKHFKYIIENSQEFDEISLIGPLDRLSPHSREDINLSDIDIDDEYTIRDFFDDIRGPNIAHNILKKSNNQIKNKIMWRNGLKIDNYTDFGYVRLEYPHELNVRLFDQNQILIGKVNLEKFSDGYMVKLLVINEIAKGQNLGIKIYERLVEYLKKPLYSDYVQTPQSKKYVWERLFKKYPNRIFARINQKNYPVYMKNDEMLYDNNNKVYFQGEEEDKENDYVILKFIP